MNWLDKLERKFGRYAIRNLPLYIVMLYAIGAVLNIMTKGSYYYYVALNPYMILHGQVWRLLGFLIVPPNANIIYNTTCYCLKPVYFRQLILYHFI